jgi:hypothetical protein
MEIPPQKMEIPPRKWKSRAEKWKSCPWDNPGTTQGHVFYAVGVNGESQPPCTPMIKIISSGDRKTSEK